MKKCSTPSITKPLALFNLLVLLFCAPPHTAFAQLCDSITPTFMVDLSYDPNANWISPNVNRDGNCCNTTNPDKCIEFVITLHPDAEGIIFDIFSGAIPPGALFYQVNCGPPTQVGDPLCLNGPGPHIVTFCKPGNNNNEYIITSIAEPGVSDDITINDGCNGMIYAFGYDPASIVWTSIQPGTAGAYDSYLNCLNCDTVYVNAQPGYPPYVDYQVCGYPLGGCDSTLHCDTVRVYFNSTLSATILPVNPVICYGASGITLTGYGGGGTPPYSYSWSTGDTTSSIFVNTGTYILTVSDTSGCPPTSDTITVTAFSQPITANAGNDQLLCLDDPVVLSGSITAATGGTWSGGNGTFAPHNDSLNTTYLPTAQEIAGGGVTLFLTTTGNNGCPAAIDTVHIVFTDFDALIDLTTADVTCNGYGNGTAMVTLTGGTAPFNISWNTNPPQTGALATGLAPGNYSVTIVNGNGCDTTVSFTIAEPSPLSSGITNIGHVSCFGGNDGYAMAEVIGGTPPYNYQWNTIPVQYTAMANGLSQGTYTATITDANGCIVYEGINISAPTPLTITMNAADVLCYGGSSGSAVVNVQGGTPPYNYLWNTGATTPQIVGINSNTYSVTVTDNNNCAIGDSIAVNEPSPVMVIANAPDTICPGTPTLIGAVASGGSGNYSYQWQGLGNGQSQTVAPQVNTTYTVTAFDANGCSSIPDSIAIAVQLLNLDAITTASNNICIGDTAYIFGTDNNTNVVSYSWNNNLGIGLGPFAISPQATTSYILTATDICGQTVSDTTTVEVYPLPSVSLSPFIAQGCPPLTVDFQNNAQYDSSVVSFLWDFDNGVTSTDSTPTYTYTTSRTYQVGLTVTSSNGCINTSNVNGIVQVFPKPVANFDANRYRASILDPEIMFYDASYGGNSHTWDFGDGNGATDPNPGHFYDAPGTYNVVLTVANNFGCIGEVEKPIIIDPGVSVYIPNAFTPNGDGTNDYFFVQGEGLVDEGFELLIFDRWGNNIFQSNSLYQQWDGRARGGSEIAQIDVYVYKVRLKDELGGFHDLTGHVSIVK